MTPVEGRVAMPEGLTADAGCQPAARAAVVHVTECRLCGSPDLDLVVAFTPTPPGDAYLTEARAQPCYPLDVLRCRACEAVQLAHTVDPKVIYTDYLYTTSVSKGLDKHYDEYARSLARWMPLAAQVVVDIGSNNGTLLSAMQARYHCVVLGIEPAKAIADEAPVSTLCAYFSEDVAKDIQAHAGSAHVITANHVMANVADLPDFIKGVQHLLAPGGTFVFETGYWSAIVHGFLIDTIEHEHIHYFAVKPLQAFFRRYGLELVHAEVNTAKGGSLRGFVQHAGATPDGTVAALIAQEERMPPLDAWVRMVKGVETFMRDLIASSPEETWVGYGAAVGSTLLLHQWGLGEKLTCLVDANPQKQGRVSPGYHLEVKAPSELAALKPDRIVILAWRYAELIRQQHPELASKFLVPLPVTVMA